MKLWEFISRNRRAWINALMSEKYKQGKGYLNDKGEYCCLGVACEAIITGPDLGVSIRRDQAQGYESGTVSYDGNVATLDPKQLALFGLSDNDQQLLVALNDNGAPFKAIAQALEYLPYHDLDGHQIDFDSLEDFNDEELAEHFERILNEEG